MTWPPCRVHLLITRRGVHRRRQRAHVSGEALGEEEVPGWPFVGPWFDVTCRAWLERKALGLRAASVEKVAKIPALLGGLDLPERRSLDLTHPLAGEAQHLGK